MMQPFRNFIVFVFIAFFATYAQAQAAFDHSHAQWSDLLKRYVVDVDNGHASRVKYAEFKQSEPALDAYLATLSAVSMEQYQHFSKEQQMAFLINAYNAFTIKLILTHYPKLKSIRDLGNFLQSPWKKSFFNLLGAERYLDWIEHEMLRKEGVFDDPRIHFAVNCASIGCPKLANEAFQASLFNQQLDQAQRTFLADKSRNYYDGGSKTLYLSKIFDWFEKDFKRKYGSLNAFAMNSADVLSLPANQNADALSIKFTDYDWTLNDAAAAETQPDHSSRP